MKNIFIQIIFILCFSITTVFFHTSLAKAQNTEQELFLVAQKAFEDGFYDFALGYIDQLLKEHPHTERLV
ncbi:MAG: hypothetical protein KC713_00510, partial [Candidatus Omnitrophica bacterium]|nr:hypothetical protein [Candidatus Omnitrophota bacterium]